MLPCRRTIPHTARVISVHVLNNIKCIWYMHSACDFVTFVKNHANTLRRWQRPRTRRSRGEGGEGGYWVVATATTTTPFRMLDFLYSLCGVFAVFCGFCVLHFSPAQLERWLSFVIRIDWCTTQYLSESYAQINTYIHRPNRARRCKFVSCQARVFFFDKTHYYLLLPLSMFSHKSTLCARVPKLVNSWIHMMEW